MEYCMVFSTCATQSEADKIADVLLQNRLASCVQFIPITSRYWWHGNIEQSGEIQMCIKTTDNLFERVQETIKENHSYEVPEIIKIQIDSGLPDYLRWISAETIG